MRNFIHITIAFQAFAVLALCFAHVATPWIAVFMLSLAAQVVLLALDRSHMAELSKYDVEISQLKAAVNDLRLGLMR